MCGGIFGGSAGGAMTAEEIARFTVGNFSESFVDRIDSDRAIVTAVFWPISPTVVTVDVASSLVVVDEVTSTP